MADRQVNKCEFCGAEFFSYTPKQRFCSGSCRNRARYLAKHPGAKNYKAPQTTMCVKYDCQMHTDKFLNNCEALVDVPKWDCPFFKSVIKELEDDTKKQ